MHNRPGRQEGSCRILRTRGGTEPLKNWQPMAWGIVLALLAGISGCGVGPRTFRKIRHPAPLMRARAVGLSDRRTDQEAIPALVNRLDDTDPVVRMAAGSELKRRTGQDFGFVPWAPPEERTAAVGRWKSWLSERSLMSRRSSAHRATPPVRPAPADPATVQTSTSGPSPAPRQ
jgi:hypothetical protein